MPQTFVITLLLVVTLLLGENTQNRVLLDLFSCYSVLVIELGVHLPFGEAQIAVIF